MLTTLPVSQQALNENSKTDLSLNLVEFKQNLSVDSIQSFTTMIRVQLMCLNIRYVTDMWRC
jgi:hypothetical protein